MNELYNDAVPPSQPKITDENGRPINSFRISSLDANKLIVLRCLVSGGRPAPKVAWHLNDQEIPSTPVSPIFAQPASSPSGSLPALAAQNVHVEEIQLGPLKRSHQDARLTCSAVNSDKDRPTTETLTLEITRKSTHIPSLMT